MLIKVPVTVIVGRQDGELTMYVFEGRNISTVKCGEDIPKELIEMLTSLEIENDLIRGHVAITSFGHSTIKAVDPGSREGICYITRSGELVELPKINLTKTLILNKDFGRWVNVLSLPIFLNNIMHKDRDSIVVAPSRLGENLCITFGYVNEKSVKVLKHFLNKIKEVNGQTMITVSCIGRIPQIPLEISIIQEDKYLLFRIYLNTIVKIHSKSRILIVIAKGGNVVKRFILESIDNTVVDLIDSAYDIFKRT